MGRKEENGRRSLRLCRLGKRILAGALALALAVVPVPAVKAASVAEISGFKVWIQWASGSSADVLNWNASREEEKTLVLQVHYRSDENRSFEGIPANSIRIRVPGIGMACRDSVKRAESTAGSGEGEQIWGYTYEAATDTYVFTNEKAVEGETSLAGVFQLAWNLNSREVTDGYGQTIQAVLERGGETALTNGIRFSFTSREDTFALEAQANALEGPDGLGEDANSYYWVRYGVKETISERSRAAKNKYYTVELPEGAELKRVGDGTFERLGGNRYRFSYGAYQNVYIAYPKEKFGGTEVEQTFSLYGTYLDREKEVLLAEDRTAVIPNDYGFVYNGNLYWVGKGGWVLEGADAVKRERLYQGQVLDYTLMAIARHPVQTAAFSNALFATAPEWDLEVASPSENRTAALSERLNKTETLENISPVLELSMASPSQWESYEIPEEDDVQGVERMLFAEGRAPSMDLYLCDDFIDITGADGSFRQLGDEEYELVDVTIPSRTSFTNANGFPVESGKYTVEIVLGTDRHAEAAAAFPVDGNAHTYRFPQGTNRFFIRIRDVKESLYINQFDIRLNVKFHLNPRKPVMESGVIRNNDGLIVEYGGVHHNTVFDDSYLGSDGERVRKRDLDTYGLLVQRWYYDYPYESDTVYHDVKVSVGEFEGGEQGYQAQASFRSEFYRAEDLKGWEVYSLLPAGVTVDRTRDGTVSLIGGFFDEFGSRLDQTALKDGFSLQITDNYNHTGRTLVKGRFDYAHIPVSCPDSTAYAVFQVPLLVSFEDLEQYGTSYVIGAEQLLDSDGKGSSAYGTGKNGLDDGTAFSDEAWSDINGDGETDQALVFHSCSASIAKVMATQIELKKFVSTPRTYGNYWTNMAENGEYRDLWAYFQHRYTYRLNLKNTGTPATHVVIYDELERGVAQDGSRSQWGGVLETVDTSRAEALGLGPVVWYSTAEVPGTLNSGNWSRELPPDRAAVTAVAVSFEQERMKPSQDVWVDLHMTAPEAQDALVGKQAVNGFSITFQAAGREDALESNPVAVKLDHPKGTAAVEKVDEVSGEKLSGFEFELLEKDGSRAAVITENGMAPEDVKTGTYTLRETRAPQGYEKAPDQEVTLEVGLNRITVKDPRIPGAVKLIKKDASDSTIRLSGGEFRLCKTDGTLVEKGLKTDENGELTVENLEWGDYYLEEVKAPEGHYLYGSARRYFTVGAKSLVVRLEMENRSYGTVTLEKRDGDQPKKTVSGAVYELYDSLGNLRGTYTTDRDGRLTAEKLEWGSYYFLEKEPAPGYELREERIEFTVYGGNVLEEILLETTDEEQTAAVHLTKSDRENGEKLAGAVYSLKREGPDGDVDMGIYKTDRTGELFIEDLKFGDYRLEEIGAPEGYRLPEENQVEFRLDAETAGMVLELEHENDRKKGALLLKKVDEEGVPVAGAVFDLYKDGALYMEGLVSDEFGLIEVGSLREPVLEWGTYELRETGAPKGYEPSEESLSFVIDAGHVRVPVTVTAVNSREKGTVRLVKYKKGDRETVIPGAVYGLYNGEGVCVQKQTTDEKGEALFEEIPWGSYYLQELSAPEPYGVSEEKLRFSVNRDNCHITQLLEGEDEVRRTSLTIVKQIGAEDVYQPYGTPTFLYRIEGKDGTGVKHTWYRQIVLGEGEQTGSVTLQNIEASDENGYRITELDTVRYELEHISGTHIRDIDVGQGSAVADLCGYTEAEAVFENHLTEWQKVSHTANAVNVVKKERSLTYLEVEYTGPEDVTELFADGRLQLAGNRDFLESYLTVTAYYDGEDSQGNISRVLSWKEYRLEPEYLEGQGTAAPYAYQVQVSYEEKGTRRSGSFQVEARADRAVYTMVYHNPFGKNTEPVEELVRYGTTWLLTPEEPAGYQFDGWYETADFAGTGYRPGDSYENKDRQKVDLYGKWTPIPYRVTYHLEGGTLSGQKTEYTVETETFYLPQPQRDGYTFAGWTGSNGGTPQKTVSVERGSVGNKEFTACWTPVTYAISYQLNGGTITGQKTSYTAETADFLLPTPVRAGYRFTGWTGSNGTYPQTQVIIRKGSTGNRSYTANWQQLYGVLIPGMQFNETVKELSTGVSCSFGTANTVIRNIAVANSAPEGAKTVRVSESGSPAEVLVYFEETSGTLYLVCESNDIRLNARANYVFNNMDGLTKVDLTMFNTSEMTNTASMFNGCENLTEIRLTGVDTSNVTIMSRMFADCKNLKTLDLSSFSTQKVTTMQDMFSNSQDLSAITYGSGFVYPDSCNTEFMYYKCPANKPAWNGTWTAYGKFTPAS